VPGQARRAAGHERANVLAAGVLEDLRFLIEAHELGRVVLIAHDGCAFYIHSLQLEKPKLEPQQQADLRAAAEWIRREVPGPSVEAYFARRTPEEKIAFELVAVDSPHRRTAGIGGTSRLGYT
jgi:hypothetical protein